ncbi:MAG TPA: hypothetical protein VGD99_06825 [Anaerolineae bacterium]|jgi:hypothetical protein
MQQRHNDRLNWHGLEALSLSKSIPLPFLAAILVLALASLSCGLLSNSYESTAGRSLILTRLPTLTPTASPNPASEALVEQASGTAPTLSPISPEGVTIASESPLAPLPGATAGVLSDSSTPNQAPTQPPVASPNQAAAPTQPPVVSFVTPVPDFPTSTPVLRSSEWSFANIQAYPDPYGEGLVLYGDLINDSASTQELARVTGQFYDGQGQLVADQDHTIDFWPIHIIPAGGRLPFELTILGTQNIADYDLNVEAQPTEGHPHQAFEFSDVGEWGEEGLYCLSGSLQNRGESLHDYVMVVAIFYDNQDHMIKFGEFYEAGFENQIDNQPVAFDICIELTDQEIARHELRAWGE